MAPTKIDREILYFEDLKEARSSYFVEYQPPISKALFATMNLVYSDGYNLDSVAETMKQEATRWLARYPVPIMMFACDATEDRIWPHGDADDGLLIAWFVPGTTSIAYVWKINESPAFLNDTESRPDWRTIYKDVPFRTDAEVKANATRELLKRRKLNITLKIVLAIWVAVIPATWAVIQYLGPDWLAAAVLLYALWQAGRAARKLVWRIEPSVAEKEKAEKDQKMGHYFYHCERNPDGFSRLKVENLECDIRERTAKEAEALRSR